MKGKYEKISHPINNNQHKSIMVKNLWFIIVFVHKHHLSPCMIMVLQKRWFIPGVYYVYTYIYVHFLA